MALSRSSAPRAPLALLGVLSAFGPLSMDLYLPALPSMQADLGSGQSQVQLTLTAVTFGLAGGQLVIGPLSDRFGRRVPLLIGLACFALASLLCALAPGSWTLIAARLLQGASGAAGIVLARAIVRDTYDGVAAARVFALLASVGGIAPVLAPLAGGQLLRFTDWRGIFLALTGIGIALLLAALGWMQESLPRERRVAGGVRSTLHNGRALLGSRAFVAAVLAQGLAFGALFTYISSSSFVLQTGYGLTPVQFSLVFGGNGLAIVATAQLSRRVVARTGPRPLLIGGTVAQVAGGAGLLVAALTDARLPWVLAALVVVVGSTGLVLANATALAMSGAASMAGAASALVGAGQFAIAGLGAPLTGLGEAGALLPMAVVMLAFAVLGCLASLATVHRPAPVSVPA